MYYSKKANIFLCSSIFDYWSLVEDDLKVQPLFASYRFDTLYSFDSPICMDLIGKICRNLDVRAGAYCCLVIVSGASYIDIPISENALNCTSNLLC